MLIRTLFFIVLVFDNSIQDVLTNRRNKSKMCKYSSKKINDFLFLFIIVCYHLELCCSCVPLFIVYVAIQN